MNNCMTSPVRRRRTAELLAAIGVAAAVSLVGVGSASAAPMNSTADGDRCTVTQGPNKGKTGTITTEEGHGSWCEGSWGGTQCGKDRCSTAKTIRQAEPRRY